MNGYNTGFNDTNGNSLLVGSSIEWIDSNGTPYQSKIIVKDGCMIGVENDGNFVLVKDFTGEFKVVSPFKTKDEVTKYALELENGKFAVIDYEGGTHVTIHGTKEYSNATLYDDIKDITDFFNDLVLFDKHGFGFEKHHSEWQFHGDCILPKKISKVTMNIE
ncbi:hypothetical protein MZM54_03770 [[Brevibacterium] frigoritolerans]|nr:hypothetical protein [Peribacillus frigoritolerans]